MFDQLINAVTQFVGSANWVDVAAVASPVLALIALLQVARTNRGAKRDGKATSARLEHVDEVARRATLAAERSAEATERMAASMERQGISDERAADAPRAAWKLEAAESRHWKLYNVGRAGAEAVQLIMDEPLTQFHGDQMAHYLSSQNRTTPRDVAPGDFIEFQPRGVVTFDPLEIKLVTVTWYEEGENEQRTWNRPLPPQNSIF